METQIGFDITLMEKINLIGFYDCDGKTHRFAIFQNKIQGEDTTITLKDFLKTGIDNLNSALKLNLNSKQIKASLPESIQALDGLGVYINTVFFSAEIEENATEPKKPPQYALWIGIKLNDEARKKPPFNIISPNNLFLKLWNLDEKSEVAAKIKKQLELGRPEYLPA